MIAWEPERRPGVRGVGLRAAPGEAEITDAEARSQ